MGHDLERVVAVELAAERVALRAGAGAPGGHDRGAGRSRQSNDAVSPSPEKPQLTSASDAGDTGCESIDGSAGGVVSSS